MEPTPQFREQIRLSLLRHLDAASGATMGLAESLLQAMLRSEGCPVTVEQLRAELEYLRDKDLIIFIPKTVSPEIRIWRITAAGRDLWAQPSTL